MLKIHVRSARDGTHEVVLGAEILIWGLTLDEAENYAAFLRAADHIHRTRRLPLRV